MTRADRPPQGRPSRRVVVVGGGITGLAAAVRCRELGYEPIVLEGTSRTGGKLRSHHLDGLALEAGAESLLTRRPEALQLVQASGCTSGLVHPATVGASLWLDRLVPLPRQQLLGIPTDADDPDLDASLSVAGLARLRAEPPLTSLTADLTVGELVERQLGGEVVDTLVEPLLGGVYAGSAASISLDMALPGLLAAVGECGSLVAGAARLRDAGAMSGPAFASLTGGLGTWAERLPHLCQLDVRTGTVVDELSPSGAGWQVATASGVVDADDVILAVPTFVAARLMRSIAPEIAAVAARLEYASVALVTMVFDRGSLPVLPPGTGFLVPPSTGRLTKAATFVSQKWGWVHEAAGDRVVLRFSVGRHGDPRGLDLDDSELVAAVFAEVGPLLGATGDPRAAAVTRWSDSLPQYPAGYRRVVEALRRDLPAGLHLAGAAWDGVGIPACIASGTRAADRVVDAPASRGE